MGLPHLSAEIIEGIIDVHGEYLNSAKKLNLSSNGIQRLDDMGRLNEYLTKLDLSCNELEDVDGIQSLVGLEELNLSSNELSNVKHLLSMKSLTHLDISNNNIVHLRDILSLGKLSSLKTLQLAGNPICLSPLLYPSAILSAIPSLQYLDHRSRDELFYEESQRQNSSNSQTEAGIGQFNHSAYNTAKTYDDSEPIAKSRIIHLEQQLAYSRAENAAYVDMFRVAEANLQRDAPKQIISKVEQLPKNSSRRVKPDINTILSYPYSNLLKLWREKVHALTLRNILDMQEKESMQSKINNLEHAMEEKIKESKSTEESLRSRLDAAEKLISAQDAELQSINDRLKDSKSRLRELETSLNDKNAKELNMRFREDVDQQLVASSLLEVKLQKRLASFSSRFSACQDRLGMVQELVSQKDVQLRNTMAAFEAEKRLLSEWTKEEIRRKTEELLSKSSFENKACDMQDYEVPGDFGCTRQKVMSLQPEFEAFLRSVFRQLDPKDEGTVPLKLLLRCLTTAAARGLLQCCHRNEKASEVGASDPSRVGTNPSAHIWNRLIEGLEALQNDQVNNITWGEFLLLLCPKASAVPMSTFSDGDSDDAGEFHNISKADYQALHNSKLLGDLDWAMVPLAVPSGAFEADESALIPSSWLRNVVRSEGADFDVSRLKKEAVRLAKERSFLLRKLQVMNRTLERRAQSIKSYFEYDIRKMTLKNGAMQRSLSESQAHASDLEERLQQVMTELHDVREGATSQVDSLRSQVAQLEETLSNCSSREETSSLESMLQGYQEKARQSEGELRIVRKELSKAAVAQKSLQRDLKRHQATELASQELLEEYKAKNKDLKKKVAKLEHEQELLQCRCSAAEEALDKISPPPHIQTATDEDRESMRHEDKPSSLSGDVKKKNEEITTPELDCQPNKLDSDHSTTKLEFNDRRRMEPSDGNHTMVSESPERDAFRLESQEGPGFALESVARKLRLMAESLS